MSYWVVLLLSATVGKSLKMGEEVFRVARSCDNNTHEHQGLAGFTDASAVVGLPAKSITTIFESVEINEQK